MGGTTHRPCSQEPEVRVNGAVIYFLFRCAELHLRLQDRQPTNSGLIPDRCKNSMFSHAFQLQTPIEWLPGALSGGGL